MDGGGIGGRLLRMRRLKMWTQGRLAKEAGVSPTTVSGIESGRISNPHFGTVRKLARALGVDPRGLLSSDERSEEPESLSLGWAMSAGEDEFEHVLEEASLNRLENLSKELRDERGRLQELYGEFPEGSEQRRYIKRQIQAVSARSGSVTTSIIFHKDAGREE